MLFTKYLRLSLTDSRTDVNRARSIQHIQCCCESSDLQVNPSYTLDPETSLYPTSDQTLAARHQVRTSISAGARHSFGLVESSANLHILEGCFRFLRQETCYITKHYENLQAREISNISSLPFKQSHLLQISPNVPRLFQ